MIIIQDKIITSLLEEVKSLATDPKLKKGKKIKMITQTFKKYYVR